MRYETAGAFRMALEEHIKKRCPPAAPASGVRARADQGRPTSYPADRPARGLAGFFVSV